LPIEIEAFKFARCNSLTKRKDGDGNYKRRSAASVNRELQLLSKIFSVARCNGIIDSNPCQSVSKLSEKGERTRVLADEEESRLMAQLEGRLAHLRPVVSIGVNTGMRRGEILALRWDYIDFTQVRLLTGELSNGEINLPKEVTKDDEGRAIPMNKEVREILLALKQDCGGSQFVFTSARTGVNLTEIKRGFKSAVIAAGIPYGQDTPNGLVFHDLRHTFATRLADRGVHPRVIMQLLGHSSIQTSKRYTHATDEAMRSAVESLAQKPARIIEFERKAG
jgi:integrase